MQIARVADFPLDLFQRFVADLEALGPFCPCPHLAVAVSGGADSMALTLLADAWARQRQGCITAVTVDHGLRPGSAQEAMQVASWLKARGIAHVILTPPPPLHNNLQARARQMRYDALAVWCQTNEVLHCLIAQHAGDQRETVSHAHARGRTDDALAGMATVRNHQGVRFLRPLLRWEKQNLIDHLNHNAVDWLEDPSNKNTEFFRVRSRIALQASPQLQQQRSHEAWHHGELRAERDNALANTAFSLVTIHPQGYAEFSREAWLQLPPLLRSQLLADVLTTINGEASRPRKSDAERLVAILRENVPRATLHQCDIRLRQAQIRIAREPSRVASPVTLTGTGLLHWDKRFTVRYTLPKGLTLILAALNSQPKAKHPHGDWPGATPALWHLDRWLLLPHIIPTATNLPNDAQVSIGFTPAKPLAAAPFWWLNSNK